MIPRDISKDSPTFKRNVSGLGPLFFGPKSSLSRSLANAKHLTEALNLRHLQR